MQAYIGGKKASNPRSDTSESSKRPGPKKQNRPLKFGLRTHADFTRELQTIESSDNVISSSNSILSSIPVPSSSFDEQAMSEMDEVSLLAVLQSFAVSPNPFPLYWEVQDL